MDTQLDPASLDAQLYPASQDSLFPHIMSTLFIEETSHTRIDLHNGLLDNQNELQVQILLLFQ